MVKRVLDKIYFLKVSIGNENFSYIFFGQNVYGQVLEKLGNVYRFRQFFVIEEIVLKYYVYCFLFIDYVIDIEEEVGKEMIIIL